MPTLIENFRRLWKTVFNQRKASEFPLPITIAPDRYGKYQWALIDYEAYVKEGYSRNEIVYSAINYKLTAISQAPLRAYQGTVDDADLIDDSGHPLAKLALRPNEYMSRIEFIQYCLLYLNLHGNCFVYLTGINDNLPRGMYPLRPDRVRIIHDKSENTQSVIGYAYLPNGSTLDDAYLIPSNKMCHIKFPNPYDDLEGRGFGLSPMSAAAYSIDTDNEITNFIVRFFTKNGIMPGGIISLPYEADNADILKLRDQVTELYGGSSEWGKPIVIDSGGTFSHIVPSFNDMNLDKIDMRNVRRTTAVFGVPARLLGLDEQSSQYSNVEAAQNDFWQRVMYSELMLFEEEFSHKVKIGNDGAFLRFDVSGIPAFAADTSIQVATYVQLVSNFVPPNVAKIIAGLDIPDIEGGDIGYMPAGLIPVSYALNPPQPRALPAPAPNNNPESPVPAMSEASAQDSTTAKKKFLEHVIKSWDIETKTKIADQQDSLATRYEPQFKNAAISQFEVDKRSIMALFSKLKSENLQQKQPFDYKSFEHQIKLYLNGAGRKGWQKSFKPLMIELINESRLQWNKELQLSSYEPPISRKAEADFPIRSSIEGESWFQNYELKFAREINNTTSDGIHAIIRDGLADGHGTDKIGNSIEKMFEQYMNNNTSPEDWAFMRDRMPPYRTEMIARTETHGAISAGNHEYFKLVDVPYKEWWATSDSRTRETHMAAWQTYSEGGGIGAIKMSDNFYVGGYPCKHPGDRSLPLGEFINCRCVELPYYG